MLEDLKRLVLYNNIHQLLVTIEDSSFHELQHIATIVLAIAVYMGKMNVVRHIIRYAYRGAYQTMVTMAIDLGRDDIARCIATWYPDHMTNVGMVAELAARCGSRHLLEHMSRRGVYDYEHLRETAIRYRHRDLIPIIDAMSDAL